MTIKLLLGLALISGLGVASCDKKEKAAQEQEAVKAKVPVNGKFSWHFNIPRMGDQVSAMTFTEDSVLYDMQGPAYTTNYVMIKESYTEQDGVQRWIGVGKGGSINKDGVYFVLFFKDITPASVTIYKRECTGKTEAATFPYPAADAITDHGWNVYNKE